MRRRTTENSQEASGGSIDTVKATRLDAGGGAMPEDCAVIVERPFVINIDDIGSYTIMCTPGYEKALAAGFAFSEGIISCIDDVRLMAHCEDMPGALRMQVANPASAPGGRNLIVTSSCGLCGSRTVEELAAALSPVQDSLRVDVGNLLELAGTMRARQKLFLETGGTHAAAVFDPAAEIIAFAEDIGRHNALDKAIGICLLERRSSRGCGVVLSSRLSFELVAKAAKAGIEVLAGVSAPSSLAVTAAQRANMTLVGFVRGDRATVYVHPHRIEQLRARP